jgi:hypothetical protein
MFYRFLRGAAALACAALIVGCARPRDDNITAFANATGALTTFAKNTGDLNVEIDSRIKIAVAAQQSITKPAYNIDVAKGKLLNGKSDADWQVISGFLDAVSAYAKALAAANDPSLETNLGDKYSSMGSAIAKINTAAKLGGSSDDITAMSNIIGEIVKIASDLYASYQIRQTMDKTQHLLDDSRKYLQDAVGRVHENSSRKLERYRDALECKITMMSNVEAAGKEERRKFCLARFHDLAGLPANPASTLQRYDNYVAASQEYAALKARLDALNDVAAAIGSMIEAHRKMSKDLDDKTAVTNFLANVGSIADNVAKLRSAT